MMFDGMFQKESSKCISAVIIMAPFKTVVFENIKAANPLSKDALLTLVCLPFFDLNLSQIRIPNEYYCDSRLADEINAYRDKINSVNSADCFGF
jgi:hypothetical protein